MQKVEKRKREQKKAVRSRREQKRAEENRKHQRTAEESSSSLAARRTRRRGGRGQPPCSWETQVTALEPILRGGAPGEGRDATHQEGEPPEEEKEERRRKGEGGRPRRPEEARALLSPGVLNSTKREKK